MSTQRMVAAQGWRYHRHGPVRKVMQYEKFRVPFDRTGTQVVVKMLSSPVHRHDKSVIEGHYPVKPQAFPAVGGVEGMGVVEEIGTKSQLNFKPGDFVWINNQGVGTWASHIVTDADNLDAVPNRADVPIEYLSAMSMFLTSHLLMNECVQLQPNDVILQTGGAGAMCMLNAINARARGAKTFQVMMGGRSNGAQILTDNKIRGAYGVVSYTYARSNYMRRLLADLPPPKLLLNHAGGLRASSLLRHLGDNGTVLTYGNASGKPMQIPNMDLISRGITMKGFFLPEWIRSHTRQQRMRAVQTCVEGMALTTGHLMFLGSRYKMDTDSPFAFDQAWDAPLSYRKPIIRMVGDYGEWRNPHPDVAGFPLGRAVWDDMIQQFWEQQGAHDDPQSMKYYTPFDYINDAWGQARQSKELGHRDVFFRRPNAPRNNTDEAQI